MFSIESNMIIMASCIPTLGPLYEMARGRRSWSSRQRSYKSSANQLPSTSGDRYMKKSVYSSQKDADLFETNIDAAREGSQESILGSDKGQNRGANGRIQRTDQVVVEYEMRPLDRQGQPSW